VTHEHATGQRRFSDAIDFIQQMFPVVPYPRAIVTWLAPSFRCRYRFGFFHRSNLTAPAFRDGQHTN
jgi:hypothetical protein